MAPVFPLSSLLPTRFGSVGEWSDARSQSVLTIHAP